MGSDIRTRCHELVELWRQGHLLIPSNEGRLEVCRKAAGFDGEALGDIVEGLSTLPHYFVTDECVEFACSDACDKSIRALQRAGLAELRHEDCVVEFDRSDSFSNRTRYICIISRRGDGWPLGESEDVYHPYLARIFSFYKPDYDGASFQTLRNNVAIGRAGPIKDLGQLPKLWALASRATYLLQCVPAGFVDPRTGEALEGDGFHHASINAPWIRAEHYEPVKFNGIEYDYCQSAGIAVRVLLSLMRTRGIERLETSVPKLNKARARAKRPLIPDHTIVRLGYYYTKSGEQRRYDSSSPIRQCMHYRSAHTKGVWHGSGENKRLVDTYIEGYFVNYDGEGEAPKPSPKVVRPSRGLLEGRGA